MIDDELAEGLHDRASDHRLDKDGERSGENRRLHRKDLTHHRRKANYRALKDVFETSESKSTDETKPPVNQ
jgi:hypothetical protein